MELRVKLENWLQGLSDEWRVSVHENSYICTWSGHTLVKISWDDDWQDKDDFEIEGEVSYLVMKEIIKCIDDYFD